MKHGDTKAGLSPRLGTPAARGAGVRASGGSAAPGPLISTKCACEQSEQAESLRQTTATAVAETAWLLSESRLPLTVYYFYC